MSMRYPGGFIASTPVTANYPSGVWTQAQAIPYQAQNVWTRDQFWPNTTLLLQGDGAVNGAQNNTFLDSSSNNFTITRNGNTTQGSFTPYEPNGYWSNADFSNSNFLTCNPGAGAAFGTGDFTVEAWAFATAALSGGDNPYICDTRAGGGAWLFSWNPTGGSNPWQLAWYNGSTLQPSVTMSLNTWNHCAYVRSGTTGTLYLNGVAIGSWTDNFNYSASVTTLHIGRRFTISGGTAQYFPGYLSNFRIVKGTAVYTTNFTPPTAPLTAITNTVLLTCQSNRFIDNSTNAFAITVNGSPLVQAFQPFPGATTWSASVLGGSGYFDGSGDYLTLAPGAAFAFGTGDFTVEAWYYPTSDPGLGYIIDARNASQTNTWSLNFGYGGVNNEFDFGNAGSYVARGSVTDAKVGAWNHLVYVRSGTNGALLANGVRSTLVTDSNNYNVSPTTSYIGARFSADYNLPGYLIVRVVKGTALYDPTQTTYTVPTSPLTAVTNTVLLLNSTNAGIYDNSMMNNLETVGNAQVSTSVVKYGTGSMYFDGSGDYLLPPSSPNLAFGTGDCTIEFWYYANSSQGTRTILVGNNLGFTTNAWNIQINNTSPSITNKLQLWAYNLNSSAVAIQGNTTLVANNWYHVALVRNGSTFTFYLNGVSEGTTTSSASLDGGGSKTISIARDGTDYFNGYIDDLRITKGAARYIGNFTPPPARLPAQ